MLFDAANPSTRPYTERSSNRMVQVSQGLAKILKLRVYGATRPGLLCTVEVTAGAGQASRVTKTVSVEFGAYAVPALHALCRAVQLIINLSTEPGVVSAHWGGDRSWIGSFSKAKARCRCKRSRTGDGQTYDEMGPNVLIAGHDRDRGVAFLPPFLSKHGPDVPLNIHAHQEPIPGVKVDQWDYASLKRMAMQFGQVYGIDREGLLYPGGVVQPGLGRPASEVFASRGPGRPSWASIYRHAGWDAAPSR